ncbi:MAG: hypothetical protein SPI12_00080 [Actinomycetaceae bacterium]|nr:hypothetical protein [Actinomycetaceae bacterium]MDY6082253.1 hypothetical protein [Actinomycetaceae bacterium]
MPEQLNLTDPAFRGAAMGDAEATMRGTGEAGSAGAPPSSVRWDPAAFGKVFSYSSIDDFVRTPHLRDGVHRIPIPGSPPLDIFLRGVSGSVGALYRLTSRLSRKLLGRQSRLLCSFTAAQKRADTVGPYFSGLHIQWNRYVPVVSVSDPLLIHDGNVALGWYTGLPGTHTQNIIARALAHIASVAHRPLLLTGGSGGGFAAIVFAAMLDDAARTGSRIAAQSLAFVWNPQVSISDYSASQPYIDAMFPRQRGVKGAAAAKLLSQAGVIHDLRTIPVPKRLLYIQNKSDTQHVQKHAMPYVTAQGFRRVADGLYRRSRTQVLVVGDYGDGHIPPPRFALMSLISKLKHGRRVSRRVIESLRMHAS